MYTQILLTESTLEEIEAYLTAFLFSKEYHVVTIIDGTRPEVSSLTRTENPIITTTMPYDEKEEAVFSIDTGICTLPVIFFEHEEVVLTFTASEVIITAQKPDYLKGPVSMRFLLENYILEMPEHKYMPDLYDLEEYWIDDTWEEDEMFLEDAICLQTEMMIEQSWKNDLDNHPF